MTLDGFDREYALSGIENDPHAIQGMQDLIVAWATVTSEHVGHELARGLRHTGLARDVLSRAARTDELVGRMREHIDSRWVDYIDGVYAFCRGRNLSELTMLVDAALWGSTLTGQAGLQQSGDTGLFILSAEDDHLCLVADFACRERVRQPLTRPAWDRVTGELLATRGLGRQSSYRSEGR